MPFKSGSAEPDQAPARERRGLRWGADQVLELEQKGFRAPSVVHRWEDRRDREIGASRIACDWDAEIHFGGHPDLLVTDQRGAASAVESVRCRTAG